MPRWQEYANDFAHWAGESLEERALSEYLSNIDPYDFTDISELAGAAEELEGAILVNPYDIEDFSDCIKNALMMSQKEKTVRMVMLEKQLNENEHIPIAIISGRSLQDIKERVGIEDIIYAGNHGAEIWNGGKTVVSQESSVNTDLLKEFLDRFKKALSDFQGVLTCNSL